MSVHVLIGREVFGKGYIEEDKLPLPADLIWLFNPTMKCEKLRECCHPLVMRCLQNRDSSRVEHG